MADATPSADDCRQQLHVAREAIESSRAEQSFALLRPCLDVTRQGDAEPWKAELQMTLAVGALGVGDYRFGLDIAREAVAQTSWLDDRDLHIKALTTEADMHFYLGDLESALATFRRAAHLLETTDDTIAQATALKNIGITENNMGRHEHALWSLKQAHELLPTDEPEHELWISILGNLGAVYERLGAHGLALDAYREALDHLTVRHNPNERVDILLRIGRLYLDQLYLDQDLLERAIETLEQAQALARVHSAVPNRTWLASILADAYQLAGRRDEARVLMTENVRLRRLADSPPHLAADLIHLGSLQQTQQPRQAEVLFEEALTVLNGNFPPLVSWALTELAELNLLQGDIDRAIELSEQAVAAVDEMYREPEAVAGLLPGRSIYPTAITALLERGTAVDLRRAFSFTEQALSKALLRRLMLERIPLDPSLDPELDLRRQELEAHLQQLRQRLDQTQENHLERQRVLEDLAEAQADHQALVAVIRQQSPHFAALRYPEPVGVEQAQALLDDRTAFVTYVSLLGDEVAVFVVDRDGLGVVRLPISPKALEERITGYLELLSQTHQDGWRTVSRDLHGQLVAPVRALLPTGIESLILVLDRELSQLPFESLLAADIATGAERYLIQDLAISYAPSATLMRELIRLADERRSSAPTGAASTAALVIGPPVTSPTGSNAPEASRRTWHTYELEGQAVGPLPGAAAEAELVARYGGKGSVSRIGADATETWIQQSPLESFGLLHFATHGILSPQTPARSALLLTGDAEHDGFLQAREISQLRLAADLVVLSACRTVEHGAVEHGAIRGDGAQSIANSFFHAGATSVLASLWEVGDQQTRHLMASFYHHLANGSSKAEALRRAKLDALASNDTRHPTGWAAFVLIGEGARSLPLVHPRGWISMGLVAVLFVVVLGALLLGAGVVYRRSVKASEE